MSTPEKRATENRPRVIRIPADQVVEPPGIVRMREALERGEHGNPDADIAPLYRLLSPDTVEEFRKKTTDPSR